MISFKRKKQLRISLFVFLLFVSAIMAGTAFAVSASEKRIAIYSVCGVDDDTRYFEVSGLETYAASPGGTWRGDYYHAEKGWIPLMSGSREIPKGASDTDMSIRVTEGIASAPPSWAEKNTANFYSYFGSGTTYRYHVTALSNSATLKYRYWTKWNDHAEESIIDNQREKGYNTREIPDPVAGYYYTIDNSSAVGSLNSVIYASYSEGANLPFDVSQLGKYLHVRAISIGGAWSEEYVVYLDPNDVPEGDKEELHIKCGTGIAKVTATGATSKTSISSTSTTYGNFLPGETVTITATAKTGDSFSDWTSSQSLKYLESTSEESVVAKFQMPDRRTAVQANGVVKKSLTISCGKGIAKVTATGATSGTSVTSTDSTGTSGKFLAGETITLKQETKSNGEFCSWSSNRVLTYGSETSETSKTAKITMPDADTAVTANGKLYYYVTVKPGTGVSVVRLGESSTSESGGIKQKYYEGDSFTATASLKNYYISPSWSATPESYSKEGYSVSSVVSENVTYTVTAKKQKFTIRYNGLSGATPSSIEESTKEAGTIQKVTKSAPKRTGFTFSGWKCSAGPADMVGKTYSVEAPFTLKADTTFTATWKADTTTVELHSNKPTDSSAMMEHAEVVRIGESYELKDVGELFSSGEISSVSDLLDANGIDAFAVGEIKLSTGTINTSKSFWIKHPEGAMTMNADNIKVCPDGTTLFYDTKTGYYYRKELIIDSYGVETVSNYFESINSMDTSHTSAIFNSWMAVAKSYLVHTDIEAMVELKDATAEQIAAWGNVPGFAKLSFQSIAVDQNNKKIATAGNGIRIDNGTLSWVYNPKSGVLHPSYFGKMNADGSYNHIPVEDLDIFTNYIFYDESSGYYYVFTNEYYKNDSYPGTLDWMAYARNLSMGHYSTACLSNGYFVCIGSSCQIAIPSTWKWNCTDASTGEGYYSRTFMDVLSSESKSVIPAISDAFSLTGWHDKKWAEKKDGSGKTYSNEGTEISKLSMTDTANKKIILYATWERNSYKILYHGNGGTIAGNTVITQNCEYDSSYRYRTNSFENGTNVFSRWASSSSGGGRPYRQGDTFKNLTAVDGGVVELYAIWNSLPIQYSIQFHPNGATENRVIDPITGLSYTSKVLLPDAALYYEKSGYQFIGWILGSAIDYSTYQEKKESYTLYHVEKEVSKLTNINNDVVHMYALWKPVADDSINTYTIVFDGNGADAGVMENQVVLCGTTTNTLSKNTFVRTDYAFVGWNTEKDGNGLAKADGDKADFSCSGGKTITLYAQWKNNIYYVDYNKNSEQAVGTMEKSKFSYDETGNLADLAFSRTGYHTDAAKTWYTDSTCVKTSYADEAEIKNLCAKADTPPTMTLYTKWIANTYTIAYDVNGGTGTFADQTKIYDTDLKLHEGIPVREGYKFMGWQCGEDIFQAGETIGDVSDVDGAVVTLKAQWKDINPPVIIYGETQITEDEWIMPWTNENMILNFKATDFESGIQSLTLERFDTGEMKKRSDSVSIAINEEGITKLQLTAVDNCGNIRILKVVVRIDKQAPTNDNLEEYRYEAEPDMTLTINAKDTGGSGLESFALYEGNRLSETDTTTTLLAECDNISKDDGSITYTFTDDPEKSDVTYTLITKDIARNETIKVFKIKTNMGISAKAWKFDGTTVYDDTQTLQLVQYGHMGVWIEAQLTGFTKQVIYDFCDELNAMGVEDVVHDVTPIAQESTDECYVDLPEEMEFDTPYPVTIKAVRNDRILSTKLNLGHKKLTHLPRVYIRYSSGMAMPKDGGEWLDYDSEERGQGDWISEFTVVR